MKTNVFLLGGLAWLLIACEREFTGRDLGEPVAVRLVVEEAPFGSGGGLRGDAVREERVVVPLAGGLCAEATLTPLPAPAGRAHGAGFEVGGRLRVAAYADTGGGPAASATATALYEVKETDGVRSVEPVGAPLAVAAGGYFFAAWSTNSSSTPPDADGLATANFSPLTDDLLWGRSVSTTISGTENGVAISLKHQFSQIAGIVIEYYYNNGTESDANDFTLNGSSEVSISSSYAATLTGHSGAVATTGTVLTTMAYVGYADAKSRYCSDPFRVYSGGGAIQVAIPSITLVQDGLTKTDLLVPFTTALLPGVSYALNIRLKDPPVKWAGSNVYWDPGLNGDQGGLTFKKYGHEGPENFYQGVYFKWGSLVGISPVGEFDPDATTIYVYHNGQWRETTVAAAYNVNPSLCYSGFTGATWGGIPYAATDVSVGSRTEDHLGSSFQGNTGDICRYLEQHNGPAGYRIPKSAEFEVGGDHSVINYANYYWSGNTPLAATIAWAKGSASFSEVSSNDATGRQLYGSSSSGTGGYATNYGRIFPTTGARISDNGSLLHHATESYTGTHGFYWNSSALSGTTSAYRLFFYEPYLSMGTVDRHHGFSVRCVR
jgi:hypothetical protein